MIYISGPRESDFNSSVSIGKSILHTKHDGIEIMILYFVT